MAILCMNNIVVVSYENFTKKSLRSGPHRLWTYSNTTKFILFDILFNSHTQEVITILYKNKQ